MVKLVSLYVTSHKVTVSKNLSMTLGEDLLYPGSSATPGPHLRTEEKGLAGAMGPAGTSAGLESSARVPVLPQHCAWHTVGTHRVEACGT